MPSNHLILCHPFLLLPSIFPSIRVFPNELALGIRGPEYWSFGFSISPSMNIQGWFSLGLTGLISLLSKGLSRVFSSTIQKHQFFSAQPSLWSNSHIRTWLQEKPQLWLYGSLSAKWCLCFLIHCLGLSELFFQGVTVCYFHGFSHRYLYNHVLFSLPCQNYEFSLLLTQLYYLMP